MNSTEIIEGDTVQLTCLSEGFPEPLTVWIFEDNYTQTITGGSERYKMLPDGNLVITDTTVNDTGT